MSTINIIAVKTQLLTDLAAKGCTDMAACSACASQTIAAMDIMSTYNELLSYALSLYNASMWGRKKSNDSVQKERERREKLFLQPTSCLAPPDKSPDDIQIGGLILRKRSR